MSGIFGVVNLGSRLRTAPFLAGFVRKHQRTRGTAAGEVSLGRAAFAVTDSHGPQRVAHTTAGSGTLLAVYGRVYDSGLCDALGTPNAHELLKRFLQDGVGALEGLNGDYVIAVWEEGPYRLTLINDRFGLRPLYYWAAGSRFAFASSLFAFSALSEVPRTIDEVALGDYLSVGHHLENRTWYAAVRLFPPASVLTFTEGRLSLRTYWYFAPTRPGFALAAEDWYANHASALKSAVRRRLTGMRGRVCLWVDESGASRRLAAVLRDADQEVQTITAEPAALKDDTADERGAEAIRPGNMPASWLPGVTPAGLGSLTSCRPCHVVRIGRVADALSPSGGVLFTTHLAGFFGGPLFCFNGSGNRENDQAAPVCHMVFAETELRQILRPEVYRMIQGTTADAMTRSYASVPGESPAERALAFLLRQDHQQATPLEAEGLVDGWRVATPFADRDVVEAARIPVTAAVGPHHGHVPLGEPYAGTVTHDAGVCCHSSWDLSQLPGTAASAVGEFFRLARLRELIREDDESRAISPQKMCVLGGAMFWLSAVHRCTRRVHRKQRDLQGVRSGRGSVLRIH